MAESINSRNLSDIIADLKLELLQFVQTRWKILKSELHEKINALKGAGAAAAIAAVLLLTAYFLFTAALATLVAIAFGTNPYRWFLAFVLVGVLWTFLGGIAGYMAKREFALKRLVPKGTMDVLRGDKQWIQAETESRYEPRVG